MARMTAIILVAGMGSRLGRPYPKSLTVLHDGETIFSRQVRLLRSFGLKIIAVVGFKKDLIMEADPSVLYAYNPNFDTTNTSKSLLCGLQHVSGEDVLWLNGDVVFEAEVLGRMLAAKDSLVAVDDKKVSEEEVKYALDEKGYISTISKSVAEPKGEALGINRIASDHLEDFKNQLAGVDDQDYFERAMELLIEEKGPVFRPVDVSALNCVEVDFPEDLDQARSMISDGPDR